jgi:hypothetical protein
MVGITGQGTTYNLPNYVGELFGASPEDTPLLSAIGGLTGGESTGGSTLFEWQGYDLRDADASRQRLEGADAPASELRTRYKARNVVEIHQEAVALSYTRQATNRAITSGGDAVITVGGTQITVSELAWQLEQQFKQIARDVEKSFIVGQFQNPSDNTTPRKTRGLLQAITTNVTVAAALTEDAVLDLFQDAWDNGGLQEGEGRTVIVNATLKRQLTKIFIKDKGYEESSRNVGGVNLQTFETDFGKANIMLDRYMPADQLVAVSLEDLKPRFLEIPGKGHFFAEPLAKTGASDKVQIYGEIGLEYGNERKHAKLTVTGV